MNDEKHGYLFVVDMLDKSIIILDSLPLENRLEIRKRLVKKVGSY